ncbi:MAG: 16S rRNA (uracil(1498)-N(3))-methyltransferase [Armatimonadetes bacterium]|nr:16S rRNA (uracil(1498)-N(3))-methyltransferase [Armatimonadota bacterium]
MPRVYLPSGEIKKNKLLLKGSNFKYLHRVLRLTKNDNFWVFDGSGKEYLVKIINLGYKFIEAEILEEKELLTDPYFNLVLFQSLIKKDNFEWVVQKATEIGVSKIVPLITAYTDFFLNKDSYKERWEKIAQSASAQSGRKKIPVIDKIRNFEEVLKDIKDLDLSIAPYELEKTQKIKLPRKNLKNIGIFIGPEGGFTEEEISKLFSLGVKKVTLGPRILRSETAALVALSLILDQLE